MRRRDLLILGGISAALVAGFQTWPRLSAGGRLAFEPVAGLPEFRMLAGGVVSGGPGAAVLAGLGTAEAVTTVPPPAGTRALCAELFGPVAAGALAAALFSDPYCPNCRALERKLRAMDGVSIRMHEVPLLGPASRMASRAILAAGRQGLGAAMAERLQRSPAVPDAARLTRFAQQAGADAERLLAEMEGAEVTRALAVSRGLYDAFGFVGTPGLVIGRTAVNGDIPEGRLAALVSAERGQPAVCA